MPMTPTQLARLNNIPTAGTVHYTVPATGVLHVVVKQVAIANGDGTAAKVTLNLGGVTIFNGSVAANSTTVLDLSQVLAPGETIVTATDKNPGVALHAAGLVVT